MILTMKKLLAFCISYTLYYLGDLVSKPMNKYDGVGVDWLYPVYNYLMLWSYHIQRWGANSGPWQDSEVEEKNANN